MNNLENEYKNRFSNEQLSNSDFDTEGLWAEISSGLVKEVSNKRGFVFGNKYLMLLLAFLVIGSGVYMLRSNDNIETKIESDYFTENDKLSEERLANNSNSGLNSEIETGKKDEVESNNITSTNINANTGTVKTEIKLGNETIDNANVDLFPQAKVKPKSGKLFAKTTVKNANTHTVLNTQTRQMEAQTFLSKPLAEDQKGSIEIAKISAGFPLVTEQLAVSMSSLSTLKFSVGEDSEFAIPMKVSPVKAPMLRDKTHELKWHLGIYSGVNTLMQVNSYDELSSISKTINDSESGKLGYEIGLEIGFTYLDKWTISTGIDYEHYRSLFVYSSEEATQLLKENQITRIWIDKSSGDTLKADLDDVLVDVVNTRNVVHHNSYSRYSIPLLVGWQGQKDKLSYGLSMGPVFGFAIGQKGRTLDDKLEVVDYGIEKSNSPFKDFSIGIQVQPVIAYQLSDNWSMTVKPAFAWERNKNHTLSDLNLNIYRLSLGVGLGYAF